MAYTISGMDGTSPSAGIRKASLEYMRTPTPELNLDHYWTTEYCPGTLWNYDAPSSPILSCPPSWLGCEPSEDDEGDLPILDVPLSSSPPDLESSSPHSEPVEEASTSSTSLSLVLRPVPRTNSDLVEHFAGDDFGHRLNDLLLVVLNERQRDLETGDMDSSDAESHDHSGKFSGPRYTNG